MYLKNVKINNYRSIKSADITFQDGLNILIGKNGVGKSNLLQYIHAHYSFGTFSAFRNFAGKLEPYNVNLDVTYAIDPKKDLTIKLNRKRVSIEGERTFKADYEIFRSDIKDKSLKVSINSKSSDKELASISSSISDLIPWQSTLIKYNIPEKIGWTTLNGDITMYGGYMVDMNIDTELKIIQEFLEKVEVILMSEEDMEKSVTQQDLENIFSATLQSLEDDYDFLNALRNMTPISDLRISPKMTVHEKEGNLLVGNLLFEFKVNGEWLLWHHLSDGTKRIFYVISECITTPDSSLILFDEPELGIHPHQLYKLMQFIKEQAQNKQIIISTHSPIVLDILSAEELDRITIVKMGEQGTYFEKLDEHAKAKAGEYIKEYGDISYYWLHSDMEDE